MPKSACALIAAPDKRKSRRPKLRGRTPNHVACGTERETRFQVAAERKPQLAENTMCDAGHDVRIIYRRNRVHAQRSETCHRVQEKPGILRV